jgi:hypothetical protein
MSHEGVCDTSELHSLLSELLALDPVVYLGRATLDSKRSQAARLKNRRQKEAYKERVTAVEAYVLPDYGLGDLEAFSCDYLHIPALTAVSQIVKEGHRKMAEYKKSPELKEFISKTCPTSLYPRRNLSAAVLGRLGTPSVEIFMLLWRHSQATRQSLLPPENARVITSVATAGSGEKGEWPVVWDALGVQYERPLVLKTILKSGFTGRNSHPPGPGDVCIYYDETAEKHTWAAVSQDLYDQLCQNSNAFGKAHAIFHHGCISHHDSVTPDGAVVEGWADHEHWNMLYCMAMARHALEFLETGGTLVLKVRIFKDERTLHIVSLLACCFDEYWIHPNPRIQAEFAFFVGTKFFGDRHPNVTKVKKILRTSTSYEPDKLTCHDLATHQTYAIALHRASEVRREMQRYNDHVTFVMLNIIYWIGQEQKFPYVHLQQKLEALYKEIPVTIDGQLISAIETQIQRIKITLTPTEKGRLHDYITNFELEKFR